MTTMTQPVFAERHHHPATTAALVMAFWMVAAVLVIVAHAEIEPWSAKAGAIATIGVPIVTAYAYTRLVAREAGITHALGVGITWLTLSIATEIGVAAQAGQGRFTLLGSPDRPLLRNILLFAWIFAPALFARRERVT